MDGAVQIILDFQSADAIDSIYRLGEQRIDFLVEISKAFDLHPNFCRDVFVEYVFYLDSEKYQTPQMITRRMHLVLDFFPDESQAIFQREVIFIKMVVKEFVNRQFSWRANQGKKLSDPGNAFGLGVRSLKMFGAVDLGGLIQSA